MTLIGRSTPHVAWVRPPRQVRSQETLERILDAAEAVVGEKGFEAATISEIVLRANSSVGAFYARFHDKDALLGCLHERFCEEALATADAVLEPSLWTEASIRDIICDMLPFLVQIYQERRGLIRAFIVRSSTNSSFIDAAARVSLHIADKLTALLLARRDEITHPDPPTAVEFGFRMVSCMLDQAALCERLAYPRVPLSDEQLSQELATAYLSYLGVN